jgi:sugar phosphate isomerase/epimerase
MKLSCADYAFPLLPHSDALNLIEALGFDGVDIGLFENRSHLWPSREFPQLKTRAKELKQKLQARNLEAADVFLQMDSDIVPYAVNRPEDDRRSKARDWFLRTLEYAAEIGSHHLTALPGVPIEGEVRERSLERAITELRWRVEQSQRAGIVFGVEAHVGSIIPTPELARALLDAVPGLTLALDYTHFARSGISDGRAEPLIPYASAFQVRGGCEGRLQCNFAQSTIDYEAALRKLKTAGFSGWVSVEYVRTEWERCNESDNLSETILYRDFLREKARALSL